MRIKAAAIAMAVALGLFGGIAAAGSAIASPRINPPFMNGHVCEQNHSSICLGADNLNTQTHVDTATPGRTIDVISAGDGVGNHYKIRFQSDNTKCVGANITDDSHIDVKSCSGTAIVWSWDFTPDPNDGAATHVDNVYETDHLGSPQCLFGQSTTGPDTILLNCSDSVAVSVWNIFN